MAEHFAANPFSTEELDRLEARRGTAARVTVMADGKFLVAYGATLLATIVGDSYAIYLRLGDGEIITVTDGPDGGVSRVFVGDDSPLGDETFSLCADNPCSDFQVQFQAFDAGAPVLILICTDGYDKSFANPEGFLKVGSDLVHMLRSEGAATVVDSLPGHLKEVTNQGSGDDVTVVVAWRIDAVSSDASVASVPAADSRIAEE